MSDLVKRLRGAGFLLLIGAGVWCFGMTIPNAQAHRRVPQAGKTSIYYCATGVELPAFLPCKNMKAQRDI
jgi:hypothetical protein